MKRPSHATVVAYLALFIALCTGVGFAATKITSSKQIKRGVVNGGDVKDASLKGKDVTDESLTGADIGNGSVTAAEIKDGTITGSDIGGASVPGRALTDDSVTAKQIDESTLAFGRGFSAFQPASVPIDNGGAFSVPREPEGTLVSLELPPGRYLLTAHAGVSADDNGGGVYCLFGSAGDYTETGADISSIDFGSIPSTPAGISVAAIRESNATFVTRLLCSDADSGASASDRGIEAINLR